MAKKHWMEEVADRTRSQLADARIAMRGRISHPRLRRPNTKNILSQAFSDPTSLPPTDYERLGDFLTKRYGAAARFIFPHLGLGPDGRVDEGGPVEEAVPPWQTPAR